MQDLRNARHQADTEMRSVLLCLMLTGCVTWDHPQKSEEQFHADLYRCEIQAAPAQDPYRVTALVSRCMQQNGWVSR